VLLPEPTIPATPINMPKSYEAGCASASGFGWSHRASHDAHHVVGKTERIVRMSVAGS